MGGYDQIYDSFQNLGGESCKFGEVLKNIKIIGFLKFSWTFCKKMKENLGQEHVERGLLSFKDKSWNNFNCYSLKNDSFSVLTLLFHPSLPKIWLFHLHKNYIFEISNNKATR